MELIKRLCETFGPAGSEEQVRALITDEIKEYCDKIEVDTLGNLIAHIPGEKGSDRIMFCAHMDEIGLIINHIDKNGFLRFTTVGGVFPERMLFQRVVFDNGVVGTIGVETRPETPKPPGLSNMFIDIGVKNEQEAAARVSVGSVASFYQPTVIENGRIIAKALDDRIGCYCLMETIRRIKRNKNDLYFVFSTQEEVGLRGARTSAYALEPKYALAVDVTMSGDTPQSIRMDVGLGKGVAIKVKDRAFIAHPMIKERLIFYAEKNKIPYQLEVLEQGTTDAAVIQLVKAGVLSGVLSIPTRYVHSTSELCDINDVENTIKLLSYVAAKGFD